MRCDEISDISGSFLAFFTSPCLCSREEEDLLSQLPAALQIAHPSFSPQSKRADFHHPTSWRLKSHPGCILHLILLPGIPSTLSPVVALPGPEKLLLFQQKSVVCHGGRGPRGGDYKYHDAQIFPFEGIFPAISSRKFGENHLAFSQELIALVRTSEMGCPLTRLSPIGRFSMTLPIKPRTGLTSWPASTSSWIRSRSCRQESGIHRSESSPRKMSLRRWVLRRREARGGRAGRQRGWGGSSGAQIHKVPV